MMKAIVYIFLMHQLCTCTTSGHFEGTRKGIEEIMAIVEEQTSAR